MTGATRFARPARRTGTLFAKILSDGKSYASTVQLKVSFPVISR